MARRVVIPQALYQPGTYTSNLDQFNPQTNEIVVSLTRVAWPGTPEDDVARITVLWNDGSGGEWELPGGVILTREGLPLAASVVQVSVPEVASGNGRAKKNVASGTVTFLVRQALTTAITAEAQ